MSKREHFQSGSSTQQWFIYSLSELNPSILRAMYENQLLAWLTVDGSDCRGMLDGLTLDVRMVSAVNVENRHQHRAAVGGNAIAKQATDSVD